MGYIRSCWQSSVLWRGSPSGLMCCYSPSLIICYMCFCKDSIFNMKKKYLKGNDKNKNKKLEDNVSAAVFDQEILSFLSIFMSPDMKYSFYVLSGPGPWCFQGSEKQRKDFFFSICNSFIFLCPRQWAQVHRIFWKGDRRVGRDQRTYREAEDFRKISKISTLLIVIMSRWSSYWQFAVLHDGLAFYNESEWLE